MKKYIAMPFLIGVIIKVPLVFFNTFVNTFFAFCLIFPPHSGQRKQPLTLLLGILIFCSLLFCVFLVLMTINELFNYSGVFVIIFQFLSFYLMDYCMLSYVWLHFYYYIQIVPARSALLNWIKRNIKLTIYVVVVFDILFTILSKIFIYVKYLIVITSPECPSNATISLYDLDNFTTFYVIVMHYLTKLCISVGSSLSTVCYLHRHMKNMGKSGTSFSDTRLRGQMRVTMTGIYQGGIFFLYCSHFIAFGFINVFSSEFQIDHGIIFTNTALFISGTTVTLGMGQTAFRKRLVGIYKALKHVSICRKTK